MHHIDELLIYASLGSKPARWKGSSTLLIMTNTPLPNWMLIADTLEREHDWFERACLAHLLDRRVQETRRALEPFQALRVAVGEALTELPDALHQPVMCHGSTGLQQREATDAAAGG